jgi:hypothetical protein
MLELQCNKRSTYIERPTPAPSKGRPRFETCTYVGENKSLDYGQEENEDRNKCAGEDQGQFSRPKKTLSLILESREKSREALQADRLVRVSGCYETVTLNGGVGSG